MPRQLTGFVCFLAFALVAVVVRLSGVHLSPLGEVFFFGSAIIVCAMLMGTASELAQLEISQNLALVVVALLAVLPEYSIDVYLGWRAGDNHEYAPLALANMTGANRLLIGIGWATVAFLWWKKSRERFIVLPKTGAGEIVFLGLATLWSFVIPFKGTLSLLDTVALLAIFGFYLRFARAQEVDEPELVGPAEILARLPRRKRLLITWMIFLCAGAGIFASSEPFVEGLISTGTQLGIEKYYLIGWVAPLASESPEFLVAGLLVWKMRPTAGMGAVLSSQLNQWTLLVGALPVAYTLSHAIHGHGFGSLPIDARQFDEILLTATQSFLGVAVLLDRSFRLSEAAWLFALFAAQLTGVILIEQFHEPLRQSIPRLPEWITSTLNLHDVEKLLSLEKRAFCVAHLAVGSVYMWRGRSLIKGLFRVALLKDRSVAEEGAER